MRILVFGGAGTSTRAVVNALVKEYTDLGVILENEVPRFVFIKRRIKKNGLMTVLGQVAFSLVVPGRLRKKSRKRIDEIISRYGLDDRDRFDELKNVYRVESINDDRVKEIVGEFKPDIVVVNGTRIISKRILDAISGPVINMHVGITPKYRGVHGGYWAMVNDDAENCGVTIHFVNTGIDTGDVIKQKRIPVTSEDNYVTYPLIQTGEGIRLELEILREFESTGKIEGHKVDLPSHLWTHPTLCQYMRNRKKSR